MSSQRSEINVSARRAQRSLRIRSGKTISSEISLHSTTYSRLTTASYPPPRRIPTLISRALGERTSSTLTLIAKNKSASPLTRTSSRSSLAKCCSTLRMVIFRIARARFEYLRAVCGRSIGQEEWDKSCTSYEVQIKTAILFRIRVGFIATGDYFRMAARLMSVTKDVTNMG